MSQLTRGNEFHLMHSSDDDRYPLVLCGMGYHRIGTQLFAVDNWFVLVDDGYHCSHFLHILNSTLNRLK
jgi:hypothetical protein